jgi:transcriptional regulator with XRE-family HTH domain
MKWFEDPKELARVRKRLGLTQSALAKLIKSDRTLIANIEAGRRRLTKEVGELLWNALLAVELKQKPLGQWEKIVEERKAAAVPLSSLLHAGPESPARSTGWKRIAEIQDRIIWNLQEIDRLKELQRREQGPIDPEIEKSFRREVAVLETESAGLKEKIAEKETAESD